MMRSLVFHLLLLPICLALVQLLTPCSAQFAVIGLPEPILAMVGEVAELPCHLSPRMSAESMELMWRRSGLRQAVRTYAHGMEETEIAEYRGRTSILRGDIDEGKAALRIHKVRASDSGTYQCYFQDGDFFEKAQMELKVAALGSDLHIEMKGYDDGGIRVECSSAGWYPQPLVEWRGEEGESLPAMAAPGAADGEGLYAAMSSIILEGGSGKEVSCVVRNPLLSQEKTARVSIAGPFFSNAQPWQVAFSVTLPALLGILVGAVFSWWLQWKKIQALREEEQREQSTLEELKEELRRRKQQYLARDRSQAYAEWKRALYQPGPVVSLGFAEGHTQGSWDPRLWAQVSPTRPKPWSLRLSDLETMADHTPLELSAVDVILDPDTAHPKLRISEDQRKLNWAEIRKSLPDNPRRFQFRACVLGHVSFTSGRHFWEVEVGDRKQWNLGVCRENVERKLPVKITPQNGFWTIELLDGHDFHAQTDPWIKLTVVKPPKRVGVFLDYERGEVSFFDAINGLHIFTFPQASFSRPLWPLFRVLSEEPTALTVCPAPKGVGSSLLPDPLPGPSLETPVASGSADGNEDPQAEEMSLFPPAQP